MNFDTPRPFLIMDLSIIPHKFSPVELPVTLHGLNPQPYHLRNGIPVYVFPSSANSVVMIEVFFRHAGSSYQHKPLVAGLTNTLLTEGTHEFTATQIAEQLDYCGAVIDKNSNRDHAYLTLFTLDKHVTSLLPLLKALVSDPSFEEKQIEWHIQKGKQQLRTSLQQTDFVARRHFFAEVFGKTHPYGGYADVSDYDNIGFEDLHTFFHTHYRQEDCQIFIAGNCNSSMLQMLDDLFPPPHTHHSTPPVSFPESIEAKPAVHFVAVENAVQASLCIGCGLKLKSRKDRYGLTVLNGILGGYFGSRLMTNLREKKGYTYGIYSGIGSMEQQSYFIVVSNVKAEFAQEAMQEIGFEMQKLIDEPIPEEELNLAKNYLIGNRLRNVDGVFEKVKLKREQIAKQYAEDFYEQTIATIKSISAKQLQDLAQTYLQPTKMVRICAGNETIKLL